MRVEITKDGITDLVKPDRLQRFLDQGWQLVAEPAPKKPSIVPDYQVEVDAEVIEAEVLDQEEVEVEDQDLEMPTEDNKGD